MVMAQRVFDTYMDDEPLIGFLHSVSNGRIMIFAIEVSINTNKYNNNISLPIFVSIHVIIITANITMALKFNIMFI